jgi:hypothetical protein
MEENEVEVVVNDFLSSADDLLKNENSTFVTRTAQRVELDYEVPVNKDLVGEPIHAGIWDETLGEVVSSVSNEETEPEPGQ